MSAETSKIRHFVRICQTDVVGKKPIVQALTKIYGVGTNFAKAVCNSLGVDKTAIAGGLSEDVIKKIETKILDCEGLPLWLKNRQKDFDTGKSVHVVGAKLRLSKDFDIKRLRKIKCYIGMRHSYNLPVRGQRTRSNFRKGKAVGVQKKKLNKGKT